MRKYDFHCINEIGPASMFMDNKPHPRFGCERGMLSRTNQELLSNFFKCANWIKENCPNLNGEFNCRHSPYHWTRIVVEHGKAYLEYGSHGWGFDIALSLTETAVMSRGSCQSLPYAFENVFFFRNDALEEFLTQWRTIKESIIAKNNIQSNVFSDKFEA